MQFLARIRRFSTVDKAWRAQHRTGGLIAGAQFYMVENQFVAREVPAGALDALKAIESVELEAFGFLPDMAAVTGGSAPVLTPQPTPPAAAKRGHPAKRVVRGHQ